MNITYECSHCDLEFDNKHDETIMNHNSICRGHLQLNSKCKNCVECEQLCHISEFENGSDICHFCKLAGEE